MLIIGLAKGCLSSSFKLEHEALLLIEARELQFSGYIQQPLGLAEVPF